MKKEFLKIILALVLLIVPMEALSTRWGYCNNGLGYEDALFTITKPSANPVCALPLAQELGEEMITQGATRCLKGQLLNCSVNALEQIGRVATGTGENDVPPGAWYATDLKDSDLQVRCSCGCFTPDTNLLTSNGWQKILDLKENFLLKESSLLIPTSENGDKFKTSKALNRNSFTQGSEDSCSIKQWLCD
jgi:hypothetical protein